MTAPGGGTSPLRVGGLALIGVAVVAAIIGLASMATNGDPSPTAAPQPAASSTTPAPESAPPPALPPAEPVPTDDGGVPVPSFTEPAPGASPPPEQAPPPGDAPAPGPAPAPAPDGIPADPGAPGPGAPGPADGGGNPPAAGPGTPGGNGGSGARAGDAGAGDAGGGAGSGGSGASAVRAPLRVYNNSTISGLAARAAEDFRRAGWPIDEVGNYPHGIIPTTTVYFRPGTSEEAPARALGEQFGMRVNPRFEGLKEATPGIIVIVTNDYGR